MCEPEIEAAISHLRGLPHGQRLREAIGSRPMVGQLYDVAPGVYALIKPFGADLIRGGASKAEFLQAWILIRSVGTAPERTTEI